MRHELRNLTYHIYGLTEQDFDYTIDIVRRLQDARMTLVEQNIRPLREDPNAVELVADWHYYARLDTVFLWEYCLWRLQSVFEGVIVTQLLPRKGGKPRRLFGVGQKLDALEAAGYTVRAEDRTAIMEWAELRNALAHLPPEQYRPVWLGEADLIEYHGLLRHLCADWREEQRRMLRDI